MVCIHVFRVEDIYTPDVKPHRGHAGCEHWLFVILQCLLRSCLERIFHLSYPHEVLLRLCLVLIQNVFCHQISISMFICLLFQMVFSMTGNVHSIAELLRVTLGKFWSPSPSPL